MPRLITVTLNPAIDLVLEVPCLALGTTVRAVQRRFPSGKGVNVARAARTLGEAPIQLGLVGAAEEEAFRRAGAAFHPVAGETRVNVTLVERDRVTHIETQGFSATATDVADLSAALVVGPGDVVVFAGSAPTGVPPTVYRDLIRHCTRQGARCILDSRGPALVAGVQGPPWVVKPNEDELADLGFTASTEEGVLDAIRGLRRLGIGWVVVSLGARGVVAGSPEGWYRASHPAPSPVSAVGCGDALVAGIAVALLRNEPLSTALRLGTAAAVANLQCPGPCTFPAAEVSRLTESVTVERLEDDQPRKRLSP